MTNTVEKRVTLDRPQPLPWCSYAKAEDVVQHGLRRLPEVLPLVNYASAQSHRSVRYKTKGAATLEPTQILQMARVVATSFAKLEPMARHLNLPRLSSIELLETNHSDPYGTDSFGAWTKENLIFWMIRLLVLTDPTSPFSAIQVNRKVIEQSLAIMDGDGAVIGGAFNRTMPYAHPDPPLRHNDPFIVTVLSFFEPIFALLDAQDAEALTALRAQFHEFREAHDQGKVGYHFMVARSDTLSTEDTFELVAATAERYQELGYEYMVISAVNQWTGAACEVLDGVAVHFAPFRTVKTVHESTEPLEHRVTSPDGFISNKDSGSIFYVIRLV